MLTNPLSHRSAAEWAAFPRSAGDPLYGDFAFGEFIRTTLLDDLRLEVTAHPAESAIAAHCHPTPLLLLVLDGVLEEECSGKISMAGPGTLLVRPEGMEHSARTPRRCRVFSMEPGPAWLARASADGLMSGLKADEVTGQPALLALKVYNAFALLDSTPSASLGLHGYMQALLSELLQPLDRTGPPLWLEDTRRHLDRHLRERLDLVVLARRAGVHPVHLSRAFRKHFGVTMTEYLRAARLAAATMRLTTTDDPVSEVARDAGFADGSHLAREFRRSVGHSPAGYRGRVRERASN